jgi:hypothetical protein
MATRVKVDPAFESALRERLADGLTDAIIFLNEQIKDKISVQGPPRSVRGEAPRRETGALIDSFGHVDATEADLEAFSTSTASYAEILEEQLGRPYIVSTFLENADEIARRVLKS